MLIFQFEHTKAVFFLCDYRNFQVPLNCFAFCCCCISILFCSRLRLHQTVTHSKFRLKDFVIAVVASHDKERFVNLDHSNIFRCQFDTINNSWSIVKLKTWTFYLCLKWLVCIEVDKDLSFGDGEFEFLPFSFSICSELDCNDIYNHSSNLIK